MLSISRRTDAQLLVSAARCIARAQAQAAADAATEATANASSSETAARPPTATAAHSKRCAAEEADSCEAPAKRQNIAHTHSDASTSCSGGPCRPSLESANRPTGNEPLSGVVRRFDQQQTSTPSNPSADSGSRVAEGRCLGDEEAPHKTLHLDLPPCYSRGADTKAIAELCGSSSDAVAAAAEALCCVIGVYTVVPLRTLRHPVAVHTSSRVLLGDMHMVCTPGFGPHFGCSGQSIMQCDADVCQLCGYPTQCGVCAIVRRQG